MDISTLLQELVEDTIKFCYKWKKEGKLHKVIKYYKKLKIVNFEYKKDGKIQISVKNPTIYKEEWNMSDIFDLIKYIRALPSFKRCFTYIVKEYASDFPDPEAEAESWIHSFLQKTIIEYLYGNFNLKKDLTKFVVVFINDLEMNPVEWEIKIWLEGIGMEVDKIELGKGMIIRKPNADDIEYEYPYGFLFIDEIIHLPSAILEIKKRLKDHFEIYSDLEKIIIALQLYRVGSVNKIRIRWKPKSFLRFEGASTPIHLWTTTYKYSLNISDIKILPQFISKIKDKIPIDGKTGNLLTTNPISIAISRYQDAILKPESTENKIAYAIMGLEALYLKAEEKDELSRRLAQRVAKLLSFYNEEPIKIYNLVKEAYKIRSSFVHGSPIQNKKPQETKKILDNIIEYLRKSIIIFIQLREKKERFLTLIDNAMLKKEVEKNLQNLLENIKILSLKTTNNL